MNIKYFILLLFVALVSACNEEGIATLVIEDGQPSVAKMIVGQWKPNHAEKADEDGNVIEDLDITDIPDLNFGENGSGHFGNNGTGTGGSDSGNFDWSVDEGENTGGDDGYDEKGPSVTFNGERWYIFQLTKSKLIIYRVTDKYILIYYYYRVGDYNEEGESDSNPNAVHRISMIKCKSSFDTQVYTFLYDKEGRIQDVKISIKDKDTYKIAYTYNSEEVNISTNYGNYRGILNENGYVKTLLQQSATSANWTDYASISYNSDGQISMFGNYVMNYSDENRISVSQYEFNYSNIENHTIPDLNSFIASGYSCGTHFAHFNPFSLPDIFGKPSKHLVSQQSGGLEDYNYEYEYNTDKNDRVIEIISIPINRFSGEKVFENSTTFSIVYQDDNN